MRPLVRLLVRPLVRLLVRPLVRLVRPLVRPLVRLVRPLVRLLLWPAWVWSPRPHPALCAPCARQGRQTTESI